MNERADQNAAQAFYNRWRQRKRVEKLRTAGNPRFAKERREALDLRKSRVAVKGPAQRGRYVRARSVGWDVGAAGEWTKVRL